ncbi:CidA/LrgA family protein [Herbaspirillum huttiense]|uniref:CidA/LrgA family protein n=1 Tax=Herbaspirillum huttiense TaxID=863372 RepID=UPI001064A724|nr:CidA/LrgA family protein [Herbaspirillum huttiense]QBP77725.1 CidA/LrgA family protein [Herbaspirillum huttiense]
MNLSSLAILLVFQCLGEGVAHLLGVAIPGPVIGLLLLLIALHAVPSLVRMMEQTCWAILQHLSLLFLPAGVGVMVVLAKVREGYLAISVGLVLSTMAAIAVGAWVTDRAMRWFDPESADKK